VILDEGLIALIALGLLAYCVFDVIRTEASSVQNLPKMVWLLLVVFLGPLGCIAWLLLGRPSGSSFNISVAERRPRAPAPPPTPAKSVEPAMSDDEFRRRREETLRRYEAEREKLASEELRRHEERGNS
jgi:hypothetical protein